VRGNPAIDALRFRLAKRQFPATAASQHGSIPHATQREHIARLISHRASARWQPTPANQPRPQRRPCGAELALAIFEVNAVAVSARARLADDVAVPRLLREVRWHAAGLHVPANRHLRAKEKLELRLGILSGRMIVELGVCTNNGTITGH
jgi:hypothetical protein